MIETRPEGAQQDIDLERRVVYSYPGPEWAGELRNELVKNGFTIVESEDPREVIGEKRNS